MAIAQWNMITCARQADNEIIAEFESLSWRGLTTNDLDKMCEAMLDEVNDDGEMELEWSIRPVIVTIREISQPHIQMTLRETTKCGRMK